MKLEPEDLLLFMREHMSVGAYTIEIDYSNPFLDAEEFYDIIVEILESLSQEKNNANQKM